MRDFDGLYRRYISAVYRLCMRYVGRSDVAEELASEVFLTLYQQFDTVEDSQLPAWLFTVAKRRAIDYWRRQRYEELPRTVPETREASLDASIDARSLLARCTQLTHVHRSVLLLRYVYGMSRSEIAERTGLEEMQVKGYLQYALKLLRDEARERTTDRA